LLSLLNVKYTLLGVMVITHVYEYYCRKKSNKGQHGLGNKKENLQMQKDRIIEID